MREIKLRIQRKNKDWEYFELPKDSFKLSDVYFNQDKYLLETFSQFTGLHDKNGKEIYEGDIVKIHNYKQIWKHQEPNFDWRIFKIVWNRYLWSLNNDAISRPLADYDTRTLEPLELEVIGNIYENPELINSN